MTMLLWDLYEIDPGSTPITGVMFRGRVRKRGIENERNILVENTQDKEKQVRFAVLTGKKISEIEGYIKKIASNAQITLIKKGIKNPVLSKIKCNSEERYSL